MPNLDRTGLIAGAGSLPLCFARQAKAKGLCLYVVAVRGCASQEIEKMADRVLWVSVGQIGALLSFFKKHHIHKAVMHGKVEHSSLFKNLKLDLKGLSLWIRLKNRSGEGLLSALSLELKKQGVVLADCRFLMDEFLTSKSLNIGRINSESRDAIAYGIQQAKALAKLGIGQTVVVKKNAVVAVEAMEGTDQTILRAGQWAGRGTVVVKVSSSQQDWRFDVPTVGLQTVQKLIQVKASGIVLESGKSFFLEKEKIISLAKKHGFFIKVWDDSH